MFCRNAFKSRVGDLHSLADTMLADILGDDDTELDIFGPTELDTLRPADLMFRPGRKRLSFPLPADPPPTTRPTNHRIPTTTIIPTQRQHAAERETARAAAVFCFFFITLSLEMSDTKVYEP